MPKRDRLAESLDAVAALRINTDEAALTSELRKHLAHASGFVIAKAAAIVEDRKLADLRPDLAAAFTRLIDAKDVVKADPGCTAKTNLIAAGVATDSLSAEVYLRAIAHHQLEGSFGPPVDTAATMRGHAAFGLLNCRSRDALNAIAELLSEVSNVGTTTDARRAAIRALGTAPGEASAAMLRLTARRFADDPDTLAEAFASLNALEPARSFDFIAGHLASRSPDIVDAAALAIAESKQPAACDVLIRATRSHAGSTRGVFTAIGLIRSPAAVDFLLDRLANAPLAESLDALAALHLHRHDASALSRITQIVEQRNEPRLRDAIAYW